MANATGIEWTDRTWNPLRGCSRVSDGCRNCYAETVAHRFNGPGQPYEGLTHPTGAWNGTIKLLPEKLAEPWHLVKGQRIFVNSMSDLFHPAVPFEFIAAVFWVMAHTTRHTYQVLTKRPERMLAFFEWLLERSRWDFSHVLDPDAGGSMSSSIHDAALTVPALNAIWEAWAPATKRRGGYDNCGPGWPYENVWLGVSVEDQATANERIPLFLRTPAAVRWVSAEPLLGPVDLNRVPVWFSGLRGNRPWTASALKRDGCTMCPPGSCSSYCCWRWGTLNWVVAGGESGRGARPMHPDWARALRQQCAAAGVPFLFKQWGEWAPAPEAPSLDGPVPRDLSYFIFPGERGARIYRAGKKAAGRELDGVLHDAYPEVRA